VGLNTKNMNADEMNKQLAELYDSKIEKLAEIYAKSIDDALIVAKICDEALDTSGALLGEVRKAARTKIHGDKKEVNPYGKDAPRPSFGPRLIREGTIGDCPICKSTTIKRFIWFGRSIGCIQPLCKNYYKK
jgi:hypothetical protein